MPAEIYCARCNLAHDSRESMAYRNLYDWTCLDDACCDDRLGGWLLFFPWGGSTPGRP